MSINKSVPIVCFAFAILTVLPNVAEAQLIDPKCDPRGQKPIPVVVEAQKRIFRYPDMATTRAGIGAATEKLLSDRVAIIGLGGTGSYILDLLAKSPINEIHIFDGDVFERTL